MNQLNMLMASFMNIWHGGIKQVFAVVIALCALFIILVVLLQPGNSSGVSALGGTTETFLGKNKSKTFEHKMRVLTIISTIILAVLCIVFAVISSIFPA